MGQPSALYSPLPPPTVVREAPDNWQWWLAYGKHVCELSPFASPASAVGIITENVYVRTFHLCIIEPWHPLVYCHPSLPLLLPPSLPSSPLPPPPCHAAGGVLVMVGGGQTAAVLLKVAKSKWSSQRHQD